MIHNTDLDNIKNYIETKFNIKIQYFENKKNEKDTKIKNITDIFFKIFINFLFLTIFIYLFIKINLNLIKYVFLVLIIYIILIIINKFLLVINYFKINIKSSSINDIINYKDIEFKTGDIIQESYNWDYSNGFYGYFLFFYPINYFHNSMIIKYNNTNYLLHFLPSSFGYPTDILNLNNNISIEIVKLDDYLRDNKNVYYYRLFSVNKEINNEKIFNYLSKINNDNTKFSFIPSFIQFNKEELLENNSYNCLSFLLKILYEFKIIPFMNYTYFLSDDLICLPELSNYFYKKSIHFKYMNTSL